MSASGDSVNVSASEDSCTQRPATIASSSSVTPIAVTSITRPGRSTRR